MWGFLVLFLTVPAFALPGFQPAGGEAVPEPVRRAEASILKIYFPYYLTVKRAEAPALLTATLLTAAGRQEIADCVNSKLEDCSIPLSFVEGTAFRDRRKEDALWTNCHLVDAWVRHQKYRAQIEGVNFRERLKTSTIRARVYDHRGTLLVDEADFRMEVAHVTEGDGPRSAGCVLADDAVRLLGPRVDRPALPWAKTPAQPGEATYIAGYPRQTDSRASMGAADSDGASFRWTLGALMGNAEFNQVLKAENLPPEKYSFARAGIYSLFMSNDGAEGMSGGPVLNAQGEVLGIFRGILPGPITRAWPLATVGIQTDGLRYLEIRSGE
ncbi:MAG: trypsin-like peptidase domain-containing protein [Bdellovibrionaceae bacterium]|nr:trypsin-like peptidase domain-containing protein [Pseudobdellovibrionaceae bacterium]